MDALYAYPDHDVIAQLLPNIGNRCVKTSEAAERIRCETGLVPLAIDPDNGGRILWGDIGDHSYRDWQFMYTIQRLARADAISDSFVTDIDVLFEDDLFGRTIEPNGFIFHISRCGSTLLAKSLARDPGNVVVNQGGPLQYGFWAWATDRWRAPIKTTPEVRHVFRQLIYGMSRLRRPGQSRSFIKFISWNVLYEEFVAEAFPDVPTLFLYRDPVEVIASVMKETTAALVAKGSRLGSILSGFDRETMDKADDIDYLAACYRQYFQTALAAGGRLGLLHYRDLTPQYFATILRDGLEIAAFGDDVTRMIEQFRFHSKDDSDLTEFRADSADKRAALSDTDKNKVNRACAPVLERLHQSPHNLFSKNESRATVAVAAECHGDGV